MDYTWVVAATVAVIVIASVAYYLSLPKKVKTGQIKTLFLYPIKSTYGMEVRSVEIGKYGFKYDREWMLIDDTNNFLAQRVLPKMALIRPFLDFEKGVMEVSAPGKSMLRIPLARGPPKGPMYDVTIFGIEMTGVDEGEEARAWFSDFLGRDVRLVRLPEDHSRIVEQDYTNSVASQVTSYVDAFPYLIVNQASQDVVEKATAEACAENPITIRNFRPNILITGFDAFEELLFERVRVGNPRVTLYLTKPCVRCKLTTVVPHKGIFGGVEPLKYLTEQHKQIYGMHAVQEHKAPGKILHVGDPFTVDLFRDKPIVVPH